eukprot:g1927.t1
MSTLPLDLNTKYVKRPTEGRLRRIRTFFGAVFIVCCLYLLLQNALIQSYVKFGNRVNTSTAIIASTEIENDSKGINSNSENNCSQDSKLQIPPAPISGCSNSSTDASCRELARLKCLTSIRQHIVENFKPHFKDVKKVALIDVALHINIGDTLLWRAAVHLASLFGHSIQYICYWSQTSGKDSEIFPKCTVNETVESVEEGGLVLYQGGGNWGDLYRHVQDYRMDFFQELNQEWNKLNGAKFHVISLPQSIDYVSKNQHHLESDKRILRNMSTDFLTVLTRDEKSYEFAKQQFSSKVEFALSPDLAFVLGPQFPVDEPEYDVLFLIRGDIESQKGDRWRLPDLKYRFNGTGLTFIKEDWGYTNMESGFSSDAPTVVSEVRLNAAIRQISRGRVVVTNRLHGSIVANLIGRPLFWFDTKQKKLEYTRKLAFQSSEICTPENMNSVHTEDLLSASEAAIEYLLNLPNQQV